MPKLEGRRSIVGVSIDWRQWLLGVKVLAKRHTKHNYYRWTFVICLLPLNLYYTRKNEDRIPKVKTLPPAGSGDGP